LVDDVVFLRKNLDGCLNFLGYSQAQLVDQLHYFLLIDKDVTTNGHGLAGIE